MVYGGIREHVICPYCVATTRTYSKPSNEECTKTKNLILTNAGANPETLEETIMFYSCFYETKAHLTALSVGLEGSIESNNELLKVTFYAVHKKQPQVLRAS